MMCGDTINDLCLQDTSKKVKNWNLKLYHSTFTNELSADDMS